MTQGPDAPDDPDLEVALRLNRLHRFTKRSPHLVLEVHDSCEVPAGCGGVVLQWRDRGGGATMTMYTAWAGQTTLLLDGEEADSSRISLLEGDRRLVFQLEGGNRPPGLFAAALVRGEDDATVHASGAGTWRARKRRFGVVSGAWTEVAVSSRGLNHVPEDQRWWFDRVVERGAALVDLPFKAGIVETSFSYVDPYAVGV